MVSMDRRSASRQKLFDAAVELIAEQGFSATTVDDIALRAGVAKVTVYYNFASKTARVTIRKAIRIKDPNIFILRQMCGTGR